MAVNINRLGKEKPVPHQENSGERTVKVRALRTWAGEEGTVYRGAEILVSPRRLKFLQGRGWVEVLQTDVNAGPFETTAAQAPATADKDWNEGKRTAGVVPSTSRGATHLPVVTPAVGPAETPISLPTYAPVGLPAETPLELPEETPAVGPQEAPAKAPAIAPDEDDDGEPVHSPKEEGVCAKCMRSYKDLQRHIARVHPAEPEPEA